MSLNKSKSSSSSSQSLDPGIMAQLNDFLAQTQQYAAGVKPYDGQINAGTTPGMQSYLDLAGSFVDPAKAAYGTAASGINGALTFQPSTITAPAMSAASAGQAATVDPTTIMQNLTAANASGIDRGSIRDVVLPALDGAAIRALFNPFEDSKVAAAQNDFERQRQIAQNADAFKFKSGAWGGSRQGVQGAQTNEAALRAADSAIADLRLQGWNSAGQLALGARGQDLSAMQGNQQADQFVAGQNAETSRFNAGQKNDMSRFGAGILSDLGQFNATATNTRAEADAGRTQDASKTNVDNALQAAIQNQDAETAGADIRLRGAGAAGDLATNLSKAIADAAGVSQNLAQGDLDRMSTAYQQALQNGLSVQQALQAAYNLLPDPKMTTSTSKGSSFGFSIPKASLPTGE
jgi:hypothetical protein